ncbi:MAG: class I SAM-dependent methyltransferase [Candidatus Moranbacteria bacterium]|jgi:hypothetical protein|nr:class I SAM-dependent methyltransferase [Candidatus Moranbacteria bacterium]
MREWKYYKSNFEFDKNLSSSWWGHTFFAYDLVRNMKPKRVVELGTHYGVSFLSMCQAVKDAQINTELHAVDTWEGDPHAKVGYDKKDVVFNIFKNQTQSYYKGLNIKFHRKFFDDALDDFEDNSIDVLHIDGFHTYESVKHDFEKWLPKMRKDGLILLHDIHERKEDFGVYKLWYEIKKKYSTTEFYHWHGLGVVFLDNNKKADFIEKEDEMKGNYNNIAEKFFIEREKTNTKEHIDRKNKEIDKKNKEIELKNEEIELKNRQLKLKEREIESIKSSKFWKLRNLYIEFKSKMIFLIFHPISFAKKYTQKIFNHIKK